jgi:hypothetical protein
MGQTLKEKLQKGFKLMLVVLKVKISNILTGPSVIERLALQPFDHHSSVNLVHRQSQQTVHPDDLVGDFLQQFHYVVFNQVQHNLL